MFLQCLNLLDISRDSYDAIHPSLRERDRAGFHPLVTIVFAAAAVEAFINEVGELARMEQPNYLPPEPPQVVAFGGVLEELEDTHASVLNKFSIGRFVLSGTPFDRGCRLYQDFALLFDVRNAIMHMKPFHEWSRGEQGDIVTHTHKIVARLEAKNLVAQCDLTSTPWAQQISTPGVAQWALNTAIAVMNSACDAMPHSSLKERCQRYFASHFVELQ
jgi:hypothetical protein